MSNQGDFDPFDQESRPGVSFDKQPIGTVYKLLVDGTADWVQSRDYDTGDPATWPDGNPKMAAVLPVIQDGEDRSLWAPKPSAMFRALADAQKAAGARFAKGGTLVVKFTAEKPVERNPKLNKQKLYEATYSPPDPFGGEKAADDEPPF